MKDVDMLKKDNQIEIKSREFAIQVVLLVRHLQNEQREYVLSKQLLRSGTSIGANVKEALRAQSKADFIHKMSIALKEASETEYWLEILHEVNYISDVDFDKIYPKCNEVLRILMSIVKTSKNM